MFLLLLLLTSTELILRAGAHSDSEYALMPAVHRKTMHVSPFNPPVAADGSERGAAETEARVITAE